LIEALLAGNWYNRETELAQIPYKKKAGKGTFNKEHLDGRMSTFIFEPHNCCTVLD
jgi:hypothetical protein